MKWVLIGWLREYVAPSGVVGKRGWLVDARWVHIIGS